MLSGGLCPVVVRRGIQVSSAPLFQVQAKQNTLKRQRQAEKARIRNKSRKSAVRTRMKKVGVEESIWGGYVASRGP